MSYSFSVRAATKAEAKEAVAKRFDEEIERQPIHARDRAAAIANANAVIDLLVEDPACDIRVGLNGYVGWRDLMKPDGSNDLSSASVCANAALISKETAS